MSEYDPFEDIQSQLALQSDAKERYEDRKRNEREWQETWSTAIDEFTQEDFGRLGGVLRRHSCGFWLDYLEVLEARCVFVLEKNVLPGFELNRHGHARRVIVLKLLKFAFTGDVQGVQTQIDGVKTHNCLNAVRDELYAVRDHLQSWGLYAGSYPRTPYMSRTELGNAPRRRITGYASPSDITKRIDDRKLIVEQESIGKPRYARFCALEPAIQREILRYAVPCLKNAENLSFFSGPIWTTETDDSGG